MAKFQSLLALLALVPALVHAQQSVYGQCGGIGWTGPTTCASGSVCTEQNSYYSQCLPGSAAPSSVPPTTVPTTVGTPTTGPTTTVSAPTGTATPAPGNPFTGFDWYLSPYYASEVSAAAAQMTGTAAQQASSIANIPTFIWFDQVAKVPQLSTYLADASAQQKSSGTKLIVPIVVYDLPDRDCAAAASNGEFTIADNGQANYENYIDQIAAAIAEYPDVRVVAIIEPDSLANLVTNLSVAECSAAESTYKACITYALQQLAAVGVYMYMDAGHAGWLGWPANLSPAAQLFASMYEAGGSSPFIRGLATNVANYNALVAASPDPITQGNPNYDESLYISALAPMLSQQGFPAQFVVEQARSGVQNIRQQWGDWCNVKGAGFGTQPTTNTGNSLIDAIVWVKPGGESDGTSNTSAARYDYHCGLSDADQPSPEAGTWFQEYFQTLISQANPPIAA